MAVAESASRAPTPDDVRLLWSAASPYPDPAVVSDAAARADIGYVLETAAAHRVAPLVLRALRTAGVAVTPEATRVVSHVNGWRAHASIGLPSAVEAALDPLGRAGLAPLLLKGLALIGRYPAPGLRPMDDIDLLLPPKLTRRAADVLLQAGWMPGKHTGTDPRYDLTFRHQSAPGVPLELHYQLLEWRERPKVLEAERLWDSRVPTTVFGYPAYLLPPELELIALIVHAAKAFHMFSRVLWAVDLVVASRATALDWDEVARLAALTRRRVATAVALRLATRLGANVPAELLRMPAVLERAGALTELLSPVHPFVAFAKPWWVRYTLVDTLSDKSKLAIGELLRPPRSKRRSEVVGDLARLLYHAGPAILRARLRAARGG